METGIIIGVIGLIVGLISLLTTYIFYKRSLKLKIPLYTIESRGPLGGLPETLSKLSLNYDGEKIKYFTVSRIAIWNAGKDTIHSKDIVDADKICIIPEEGYEFFEANIRKVINPLNNFSMRFSTKEIVINFDYMDFNEGCCVEVYHSGKTSWALQVKGSIKGSGKIKHAIHIPYPTRRKKAYLVSILTFIVGSLISLMIFGWQDDEILRNISIINLIVAGLVYSFTPMIISQLYFKRNWTSVILGVRDDDELLRAPDFPPTGRVRERDKDADPIW
ncbi:MAG: hypothetical protein DAHOPDDO_00852 [Ignavibacteriaceae bacterium]|nr:hypothetical protein [Ignavibacteriaceae bacterium]